MQTQQHGREPPRLLGGVDMTLARLYTLCSDLMKHGTPGNADVVAWNPDSEQLEVVSGVIYNKHLVEICTDDN